MSYSAIENCNSKGVRTYFYPVRQADETTQSIAEKLGVSQSQISWDKADSQPQVGDIVVVNLG